MTSRHGERAAGRAARLWRILRIPLLAAYGLVAGSFLLFLLLEIAPALTSSLGLQGIRYFALRSSYTPDPDLVFVLRHTGFSQAGRFRGDLYDPGLGVDVPWRRYRVSFNDLGFRTNSSRPPFSVALIGDSYVATGDTDAETLSELLRSASGLSTFNLGRGWYGPAQYVEIARRFLPELRPRYAVLTIFAGNDLEDLRQYESWRNGGNYYDFRMIEEGLPGRYWSAVRDTATFLRRRGKAWIRGLRTEGTAAWREHPRVGEIDLGDRSVVMRFGYLPETQTASELRGRPEWIHLGSLLAEFSRLCSQSGAEPIVVYAPMKFQIYAPLMAPGSGEGFRAVVREHLPTLLASRDALVQIAAEAGIEVVDLVVPFRERATHGELLYHPFDTHWNREGRRCAAELLAARLGSPGGSASRDGCGPAALPPAAGPQSP